MENNLMKQHVAAKAFIVHDGKVLIIREAPKYEGGTNIGKYDFPGGKIKPGENFKDALKREVIEECGLKIKVGTPFYVNEWRPTVRGEQLQIIGIFFECSTEDGVITPSPDHDDYRWIDPEDYQKYNLIQATRDAFERYNER